MAKVLTSDKTTPAKMEAKLAKEIRATLAALGGKAFADDDIIFHAEKTIVLPIGMSLKDAQTFLGRKEAEQEEVTQFIRKFNFRPWDGAYCAYQAMKNTFGAVLHSGTKGFFATPPQMISIEVDYDQTEQIPWGQFEVPMLPGVVLHFHSMNDKEYGPIFVISAEGPKKYAFEVEGIFNIVEAELRLNSIYKGKAIDGKDMPSFLNKDAVDPEKVVYTELVRKQMNANIYALLRYSQSMRENGVPLKRSVLLHGPYGGGKTLAGFLVAQEATANGWGFIYVRPNKDNVFQALQTARMYAPAVVFFEDVDTIANPADMQADDVSRLLDEFDGIAAKGSEVIVMMTTNHPDKLHKGMLRPGRLDALIEIAYLDDGNVQKLCKQVLPVSVLSDSIDWDQVAKSMDSFMPSFIKEAADRAFRASLSENGGVAENVKLETLDFLAASDSLRSQLELMNAAPELTAPDDFVMALRREIAFPLTRMIEHTHGENYSVEDFAN